MQHGSPEAQLPGSLSEVGHPEVNPFLQETLLALGPVPNLAWFPMKALSGMVGRHELKLWT